MDGQKNRKQPLHKVSPYLMNEVPDYMIGPEGSLGLLALGHMGIDHWRSVREKTGGKLNQESNLPTNK